MEDEGLLTFRLLGTPRMTGEGAARARLLLEKPKLLALLLYLSVALPRGLRRRDELLAILWQDSDPAHGRNALRQSLHSLRTFLPEGSLISRGSDEIGFSEDRIAVDVTAFESHLDAGRESEALALYSGSLVNGFGLRGNLEFDAWLVSERERLHRRAVRGALVLAKGNELDGDPARAAEWARFAIDRAPYDEFVLRNVVELLLRLGDRAGATLAYDTAVRRFTRDLGATLSPETARLASVLTGREVEADLRTNGGLQSNSFPVVPVARVISSALVRPRVVVAEARRLNLEARQFAGQRSPVTIMKAIECYERAIRLSPDYAEAHAGLASALCQAPVYVAYPGTDAWPRVRAHASRALRLDPRLGDAHAALGLVTLCCDYEWARAQSSFVQALELDAESFVLRQLYALYYLTSLGQTDAALSVLDRARDDNPDVPGITVFCGMSAVFGRQFERGLREADFVIEGQPMFVQAHWVRGMALEGLGDLKGAIRTFEHGAEMTNRSSLFLSQMARACAAAGEHGRAMSILAELEQRCETGGPGAYFIAEVHAALGNTEVALDCLYAAYRQRNPLMVFAGVLYGLDPLRGMRKFRDLLMRLALPVHEMSSRASVRRVLVVA